MANKLILFGMIFHIFIGTITVGAEEGGFIIHSLKFYEQPSLKDFSWLNKDRESYPVIEVLVSTQKLKKSDSLYCRIYFYDNKGKLIHSSEKPEKFERLDRTQYTMPIYFRPRIEEPLYFIVPQKVLAMSKWCAVVVFGDSQSVAAASYPAEILSAIDFPEKKLVYKSLEFSQIVSTDKIIEYIVQTDNRQQPEITFFLRIPLSQNVQGVLAMCLLASSPNEIKQKLQNSESNDEIGGLIRFAQKNNLAIICWGARSLWNPRASWHEQTRRINREMDQNFDDIADAWSKAIRRLSRKYGLPDQDYLLWGTSGAAQYATRLALRKPQHFLAVHVHIPSSFDVPTKKANTVLWCLTTGENEVGYNRSLRFLKECKKLGYPIIYKSIPGLAHSPHPLANQLGIAFFQYVLEQKKSSDFSTRADLLNIFFNPPFWGDIINQYAFPASEKKLVPSHYCVPLPNRKLAEIWSGKQ